MNGFIFFYKMAIICGKMRVIADAIKKKMNREAEGI